MYYRIFFTSLFGMGLGGQLARLVTLPPATYMPIVVVVGLLGAYVSTYNLLDIVVTFIFGILGFAFMVYSYSRVPFLIGFVLGNLMEVSYFQSIQIGRGNILVLFTSSPTVIVLWSFLILTGVYYWWSVKRNPLPDPMKGNNK